MNQHIEVLNNAQSNTCLELFSKYPKVSQSPELAKVLGVSVDHLKNLRIFDSYKNLYLYHYLDKNNAATSHVKGVVVAEEGDMNSTVPPTYKVVCRSFPNIEESSFKDFQHMYEPNEGEWENLNQFLQHKHSSTFRYKPTSEGTVLRFFNYGGEWFVSTHKRIDGSAGTWGESPTFGDSLTNILGGEEKRKEFFNLLSTNLCYVFFMENHCNIICTHATKSNPPSLNLLGVFSDSDPVYSTKTVPIDFSMFSNFPTVTNDADNWKTATFQELSAYLSFLPRTVYSGVMVEVSREIVVHGDEDAAPTDAAPTDSDGPSPKTVHKLPPAKVKVLSDNYYNAKVIRGNESSIESRYYNLLKIGANYRLRELFPEFKTMFDYFDLKFKNMVTAMLSHYLYRYVNGKFQRLAPYEMYLLEKVKALNPTLVGRRLTMRELSHLQDNIIMYIYLEWNFQTNIFKNFINSFTGPFESFTFPFQFPSSE
jgi:hypothetical protein